MASQFYPLEGCKATALATQTAMAASIMHLFQDLLPNPDPSTPLSAYTTAEATFDGYTAITLTTWNAPILAPGNGYMIQSPVAQFVFTSAGPGTQNMISGCYIVDSGGKNRLVIVFTQPVPMQVPDQGIPITVIWLFPTGL